MKIITRATLVWIGFLVLAFVNGAFRELVMIGLFRMAPLPANQLSCLTGVLLWTSLLMLVGEKLKIKSLSLAVTIGIVWVFATMLFETFVIGRKLTWAEILHTYDVAAGEYWMFVLIWLGLLPVFLYALNKARK